MPYKPIFPKDDTDSYWWKEESKSIHTAIHNYIKFLDKNQPYVLEDDKRHLKLYGNSDIFALRPRAYSHTRMDRLKLNVIKSVCDTATSKITKNKIKPTFLTEGGDWSFQQKAKKLEKFSMGQLYTSRFYEKANSAFLDCTVLGTGILKIYHHEKDICIDRVLKPEVKVDMADGIYGEPRSLFQTKYISRSYLIEMYPENESQIISAVKSDTTDETGLSYYDTKTDLVKCIEAWHLQSTKDSQDGVHAITIENSTLEYEQYNKDYFPFVFIHWTKPQYGFWGVGLGDILQGIQIEINKILKENQDIFHLCDIPQVFIEAGSKIVSSHFDNQIGTIHEFSGTMPNQWKSGQVSQERMNYILMLIQWAYEISGISQLSAQSKMPVELEAMSGKALRTYHDIETERFASVARQWEDFTLDATRHLIDEARSIDEEEGGYEVLVGANKFAEKIKWKDINLKNDQYIMKVYPTSLLPSEPAGKLAYVEEMIQAGLYGPEEGRKLLDFPDTESLNRILNADQEDIELLMETFIDKGEYYPPEPFQNLDLGIRMLQRGYLRAKLDQVPEERLELFRRWITEAASMLTPLQQPSPVSGMGQGQLPISSGAPSLEPASFGSLPPPATLQ